MTEAHYTNDEVNIHRYKINYNKGPLRYAYDTAHNNRPKKSNHASNRTH